MGSVLQDALKDLTEDTKSPRAKRKAKRKESKSPRADLTFDPLRARAEAPNPSRRPGPSTINSSRPKDDANDLIQNITALFEELGNESEGLGKKKGPEGDDLTESILNSMNHDAKNDPADLSSLGLEGELDEDGIGQIFVQSIMKKILAKDTLYEPMKDLCEKYEVWLQSDAVKELSEEELTRNRNLYTNMKELVHVYETDPDNTERLTQLFDKSKQYGSPPDAIYESLTNDIEQDLDDKSGLSQCVQQ